MTGVDMNGLQVEVERISRPENQSGPLPYDEVRLHRARCARYCRSVNLTWAQTAQVLNLPKMTACDLRKVDIDLEETEVDSW
jgi:hypothetical protein